MTLKDRHELGNINLNYETSISTWKHHLETSELFWKQNTDPKSTTMFQSEKLCFFINRDVSKLIITL